MAIGNAIAAWSGLEHSLAEALAVCLGLPLSRVRGMFFSPKSFKGKHDMLLRAIQDCPAQKDSAVQIRLQTFRSALKRAETFSRVRNQLAHDMPIIAAKGVLTLGPAMIPNDPKFNSDLIDRIITVEAIDASAVQFRKLTEFVKDACLENEPASLHKLLEQVRGLPPRPYPDSLTLRATIASSHPREASQP